MLEEKLLFKNIILQVGVTNAKETLNVGRKISISLHLLLKK